MTHDEKGLQAAVRAYSEAMGFDHDRNIGVLREHRDRAIRAAITAYQAEAWQKDATFEIQQDGMTVALASGPRDRAYAAVYGQDGPVEVFEHVPVPLPNPPASP